MREQPSGVVNLFRFISLFRVRRQVPEGQSGPPGVNTTVGFPQMAGSTAGGEDAKEANYANKVLGQGDLISLFQLISQVRTINSCES